MTPDSFPVPLYLSPSLRPFPDKYSSQRSDDSKTAERSRPSNASHLFRDCPPPLPPCPLLPNLLREPQLTRSILRNIPKLSLTNPQPLPRPILFPFFASHSPPSSTPPATVEIFSSKDSCREPAYRFERLRHSFYLTFQLSPPPYQDLSPSLDRVDALAQNQCASSHKAIRLLR